MLGRHDYSDGGFSIGPNYPIVRSPFSRVVFGREEERIAPTHRHGKVMSSLFALADDGADLIYQRLKRAEHQVETRVQAALEEMWAECEPYLDSDFRNQFRVNPEARYTELHLTWVLLRGGKSLRRRDAVKKADRDRGPDICVPESDRTIWIENISQGRGADTNPDQIPELPRNGRAVLAPKEQVALRITNGLDTKNKVFAAYRAKGWVKPTDPCVVAISGAQYFSQSGDLDLPMAVKAVFPLGEQFASFDPETEEVVRQGRHYSPHITRGNGDTIPRDGFLTDAYAGVSGLVWSRSTIGNADRAENDLVFVHNKTAENPFPERWFAWRHEFVVETPAGGGLDVIDLATDPAELPD